MSKFHTSLLVALALTAAGAAPAMAGENGTQSMLRMERGLAALSNSQQSPAALSNSQQSQWVSAQVKSTHLRNGKITVSHAAVSSIGMPAMTMSFGVADPARLAAVKQGDQISIQLAKRGAWQVVNYR